MRRWRAVSASTLLASRWASSRWGPGSTLSVGEALLSPTRSYAPVIQALLAADRRRVKGLVHCSGGGAMMRAAVDDSEMARGVGINVSVISLGVFALGAALAAVSGVVAGGFLGVYPGADFEILSYAFVVVIVGGLGSLKGALVGSLMVGLLDNFGKALFPELSYFTLFAPMAAILAVRPTGLFGRA